MFLKKLGLISFDNTYTANAKMKRIQSQLKIMDLLQNSKHKIERHLITYITSKEISLVPECKVLFS